MDVFVPNEKQNGSGVASRSLRALAFMRSHLKALALCALIAELGGIWNDLHHIRNEQVKNAFYALSPQAQHAVRRHEIAVKHLESTAHVDGSVTIDGDVDISQPVEVEIDR